MREGRKTKRKKKQRGWWKVHGPSKPHPFTQLPMAHSRQHIRFETFCLFCGKTWSVQLGSPTLSCTCGANVNVLKDLTTKSAQELETKVYNVLMETWQEKMGETRKRQLPPTPINAAPTAASGASGSTATTSNNTPAGQTLEPATKTSAEEGKKHSEKKTTTLIVQCPQCNVNVIVPDVKVFQCGACGQYMKVEKQQPAAPGGLEKATELSALTNLANSSSSSVS